VTSFELLLSAPTFLLLAAQIVALVMVVAGVRGTARRLAGIGVAIQLAVFIGSVLYSFMLPMLTQRLAARIAAVQIITTSINLAITVVGAVGLIMIGLAVGRREQPGGMPR
jgi:hypothetical protein